jgi:hypothetical protein
MIAVLEIIATILHVAIAGWEGVPVLEAVKADVERGDYASASKRWAEWSLHEITQNDPNVAMVQLFKELSSLLEEEARKQQHAEADGSSANALASNEVVDGSLSDDGQWRWDASGQQWVAAGGATPSDQYAYTATSEQTTAANTSSSGDGTLSDDGQWRWDADAQQWVAAV